MASGAKSQKGEKKKRSPRVVMRSRGVYNQLMTAIEEDYKREHPGKAVRWVYAPEDRQDFSKLIHRRAMGYSTVSIEEIDEELRVGQSSGDLVRVGDVVLMSIEAELQQEYADELAALAEEDAEQIKREYYEDVKGIRAGRHSGKPIGDVKSHEEEVSITLPDRRE